MLVCYDACHTMVPCGYDGSHFLNSPLIRSQDGVVDLSYVSVIPHQSKMMGFL